MNQTQETRRIAKAALAAVSVGGLALGVVAYCAAQAATSTGAAGPTGTGTSTGTGAGTSTGTGTAGTAPSAVAALNSGGHHAKSAAQTPKVPMALSPNWAGPVLAGGVYDQVLTTFVVPHAKCSPRGGVTNASFWAGLDGAGVPGGSTTVEQAGVRVSCEAGYAQYVPWTEDYPAGEDDIDPSQLSVAPGDTVSIDVVANPATDVYTLHDITSGATFTRTSTAPQGATDDSAECIAETPTSPEGKLYKLTNFGTASFSQCDAQVVAPVTAADCQLVTGQGCPAGSQVLFASIGTRKHHLTKVQAETMSTNGGAFTVAWHHS